MGCRQSNCLFLLQRKAIHYVWGLALALDKNEHHDIDSCCERWRAQMSIHKLSSYEKKAQEQRNEQGCIHLLPMQYSNQDLFSTPSSVAIVNYLQVKRQSCRDSQHLTTDH